MNLHTPPEIDDLSAERAERLRAGLVDLARRQARPQRSRPGWVPVAAAATGVLTVAAAVAVVPRLSDPANPEQPSPRSSAGPSTQPSKAPVTRTPLAIKWKVPDTATVVNTDLGPVGPEEAWRAAERCGAVRAGADRSRWRITMARRMLEPAWFDGRDWHATAKQKIVLAVWAADGTSFSMCDDGFRRLSGGGLTVDSFARYLSILDGGGSGHLVPGASNQPGKPWGLGGYLAVPRDAGLDVARVEMRVIWPGGTGAWHRGSVHGGAGFVEASTYSAHGVAPAEAAMEARTFDAAGRLIETRIVTV
jgi:hypothetical protein